jgi:hypothetical protein
MSSAAYMACPECYTRVKIRGLKQHWAAKHRDNTWIEWTHCNTRAPKVNDKRVEEESNHDRFEPADATDTTDTDGIVEEFGEGFTGGLTAPVLNNMENDHASSSTGRAKALLSSDSCRKETFPGAGISPHIHC